MCESGEGVGVPPARRSHASPPRSRFAHAPLADHAYASRARLAYLCSTIVAEELGGRLCAPHLARCGGLVIRQVRDRLPAGAWRTPPPLGGPFGCRLAPRRTRSRSSGQAASLTLLGRRPYWGSWGRYRWEDPRQRELPSLVWRGFSPRSCFSNAIAGDSAFVAAEGERDEPELGAAPSLASWAAARQPEQGPLRPDPGRVPSHVGVNKTTGCMGVWVTFCRAAT